jgi:glycosyltransferase involved in cell wall biosynthesis
MIIKILGMEENVNSINDIRKFVKKSKIHQINIPHKNNFLMDKNEVKFFKSNNVLKQLEDIERIKNDFDLCLVSSWSTARLAYLAGLKYIIYFVGNDIRIPPFIKKSKPTYFKESVTNLNYLQRSFYKKIFDNAIFCIAASDESFGDLQKFRDDGIRIDRTVVNTKIFNSSIKPIDIIKKKFTFFCPQRIGIEKGTDILWNAISKCKSNFEVIQIEWFDETSLEAKERSYGLLKNKPKNVKLVPKIPREDIAKYMIAYDAILGEMRLGLLNNIEREAAYCQKPVICFYDKKYKYLIDGKMITTPFKPNTNNPEEIAKFIDQVVESKDFRDDLAEKEYEFVKDYANPDKAAEEWDNIFLKSQNFINYKKSSQIKLFWRKLHYVISHEFLSKKKVILP